MNKQYQAIKDSFSLSKCQKAILVGTLLGDGNLAQRGRDFRLFVKHAASQFALARWKREKFENITNMKLNFFKQKVKGKIYGFYQFVTLTHPEFSKYRKIFYRNGKKIVPIKIDNILTNPLSLTVWIMDDSGREHAGMTLQTHNFSRREVRNLQRCLKKNFKISTILRRNKKKYTIYFPKSQIEHLYNLVKKHLLPEYKYKFPLAP